MERGFKMSDNVIIGLTRRQIRNEFYLFYKEYDDKVGYARRVYLPTDLEGKFIFQKFKKKGEFSFSFVNGDNRITKYFLNDEISKITLKNDKSHNIIGPARVYYKDESHFIAVYAIGGKYMTRAGHKNYIQKALDTTNFNRYRSLKTLEIYQEIYEFYDRKEQLKTVAERIEFLRVVKQLEK